ncbi:MAG: serine/threonine-protein phosphatase [Ruminococcaceae bacterium]|nr:serine/threonine-protein phosphatase [Oscillospiraceae bacterium]
MNKSLYCDVSYRTHIGNREEQQDYFAVEKTDGAVLAVVCDGMGGLENGALASQTAVKTLVDFYHEDDKSDIYNMYLDAVDILDESVYRISRKAQDNSMTGTTLVSAHIADGKLHWLSVGDSRLYIIRGDVMLSATRDHNYNMVLEEKRKNGTFTEADKADEVNAEALLSFIGMGGIELMDISREAFSLQCGDKILLTSDGLYRLLSDEKIREIITKNRQASSAAEALLAEALDQPVENKDNITFILINMEEIL